MERSNRGLKKVLGSGMLILFLGSICGLILFMPSLSPASDHDNLEEGLPTQLKDAYATAYRNREIQGLIRFDWTEDSKTRYTLEPRLEIGFARNWQLEIDVPFMLGDADKKGSGDIRVGALYNFNTEGRFLPALALSGKADFPTGEDSDGIDTTLEFIASKMLFPTDWWNVFHINLAWTHNSSPKEDERENFYKGIFGYSFRAGKDTILVADLVWRQEREKNKESTIFELGLRRQITPLLLLAGGIGVGFGEESPKLQATIGFQYSF